MWDLISEHRSSGILARSYKSTDDPVEGDFSVGIFFGSFESRGLVSSTLLQNGTCETSIIVFFREMDDKGLRKKYDDLLHRQVKNCSIRDPILIENRSITEVEEILKDILLRIPEESYSGRKCWFIDTSVSPKPYFLGLLGYLRQRIESPALTMFNSTGYYEKDWNLSEAFSFTEGFEEYIWIPWLWGRPDPRLPWTYLFLLGFEGDRSYGTYDRFEPEYVNALISDPGYRPNYVKVAQERNRQFLEEACPEIIYANAGDAVEAWVKIDECLEKARLATNICIVPLGPKPHALGGCLSALTDGVPAVLYLMPRSFKVRDVPRGDYIWKYELTL
jgi:hypothetical protein